MENPELAQERMRQKSRRTYRKNSSLDSVRRWRNDEDVWWNAIAQKRMETFSFANVVAHCDMWE